MEKKNKDKREIELKIVIENGLPLPKNPWALFKNEEAYETALTAIKSYFINAIIKWDKEGIRVSSEIMSEFVSTKQAYDDAEG